jgi:ubiquinone/menaquinone biosynthesis C-methylase UbiE
MKRRVSVPDSKIIRKEEDLTTWWIEGNGPIMKIVDSIDISWGGLARKVTSKMVLLEEDTHLDFACGWGSFLAQLCWRFPYLSVVGLNIDFDGPHSKITELLSVAGVSERCTLVKADALKMPFGEGIFQSVSCFMGLQDIEIGFGEEGVRGAFSEAVRVVQEKGYLFLIDYEAVIDNVKNYRVKGIRYISEEVFEPDIRWERSVGEKAVEVFARGYVSQTRSQMIEEKSVYETVLKDMRDDLETQLSEKGFYNPFKPMTVIIYQKRSSIL